ncbi:MAG: TonB family protein [Betaproteobacteria bacterium]|nr:TonB family protein [Betaproteobacteria bacterium]
MWRSLFCSLLLLAISQHIHAETALLPIEVAPDHKKDNYLLRWMEPIYPSSALNQGITGEVTIEFDIDKTGHATNIQIISSSPEDVFDDSLMRVIRYATFFPYRAASCYKAFPRTRLTVKYDLDNGFAKITYSKLMPLSDPAEQKKPNPSADTEGPMMAKVKAPLLRAKKRTEIKYPYVVRQKKLDTGTVIAQVHVSSEGAASAVDIIFSSPNEEFGEAVIASLSQWTFETTKGELPLRDDIKLCIPFSFTPQK